MQGDLWMKLDERWEYWIDMALRLSIIKIFIYNLIKILHLNNKLIEMDI
jgi:hypothetical protein